MQTRNIGRLLADAARSHPTATLHYHGATGVRRSGYPELLDEALRALTGLRRHGLRPHDTVLLLLDEAGSFLPAFWACVLGGFVPCPLPPGAKDADRDHHRHLHELLDRPLLVADERHPLPDVRVAPYEELARHEPATGTYDAGPEEVAVLMPTSGSTGRPKAVMLTHGNLLASMPAKNGFHRLTPADVSLNWIGFDHVAALLECHLLPLFAGASQVHVPPSAILDQPLDFLRLIARHGVTVTFSPNFLLGLLNADRYRLPDDVDLSCLRHIVSGGEAVPLATGTAFLEKFGLPHGVLWPAFGMTETCAGSVYSLDFPDADRGQEFAAVGRPVENLDMRISDDGELQLRGPMITPGYYRNEEATRAAFTADGWLRTGDTGRIDDGRLTLLGRNKDSIIVNGVNYYSHDIETVLHQLDGIVPSHIAAFPIRPPGSDTEQLVVAFHPATDDDRALFGLLTAVRSTVVMHWAFRPALVLPLPREEFVKNSLGKISRSALRAKVEAGEYADAIARAADLVRRHRGAYAPPRTPTEEALVGIYAELFDMAPDDISATADFFDLGGTSLDVLKLRRAVSSRLGVPDLETSTLLTAPTVRALAEHLTGGARGYDPVVPMRDDGDRTPLFCVHPGAGEVLALLDLSRYFAGDRPFHALRARGFGEGEAPFTSHAELLATYTAAIRARQPHGPYALAGYSSGSIVAFALAQELQSRGERVAFFGAIDFPPLLRPLLPGLDFPVTISVLALFLGLITPEQSRALPDKLRGLPPEDQLAEVIGSASERRLAELDMDLQKFTDWMMLAESLKAVRAEYEPSGTVPEITVFHGAEPPPLPMFDKLPAEEARALWLDLLRDWDKFSDRPVRYVQVPGEHHMLTTRPHVITLQARLRRAIDRCLGDTPPA
ncbi:non-ribosomal peptide synthetase [Streptomyces fumanus]|uniref:Peptide synthase n=1 Tax=Streptomyces fumanus TaxID=67302 RepID=A0A919A8Y8_9ACTN|nr:non-ribosomal peptide synthetase [Streptomyces fumanus]GHE93166.1 peptide synthase [Streptomyces fumanus]